MRRFLNKKTLLITGAGFLIAGSSVFVFLNVTQAQEVTPVHLKPQFFTTKLSDQTKVATGSPTLKLADNIIGVKSTLSNITTDKGNDLLVLVNKKISLPASFVPDNLISLSGIVPAYPGAVLRADAASALQEMFAAASAANLNLDVVSAYRSYSQQQLVFNGWVSSAGLSEAERFSALPGYSQHQLGTAVDLGAAGQNSLSDQFGLTPAGSWIAANCYKYGFVISYPQGQEAVTGYEYEPWHYRFIGKDNALKMVKSGLILEEFLQEYGTW